MIALLDCAAGGSSVSSSFTPSLDQRRVPPLPAAIGVSVGSAGPGVFPPVVAAVGGGAPPGVSVGPLTGAVVGGVVTLVVGVALVSHAASTSGTSSASVLTQRRNDPPEECPAVIPMSPPHAPFWPGAAAAPGC